MKKILKHITLLSLTVLLFTACSEDDYTGLSSVNYSKRTVTLTSPVNNVTFNENLIDDEDSSTFSVTVTASIAEVAPVNIVIPLVQTGGTASSDDFSVGTIEILAGFTSGSTNVTILKTGDIEGDETLQIGAADNIANANVAAFALDITIQDDYINDVLNLELNWDGEVAFEDDNSSGVYNFCGMDFDMLIFDAAFNDTAIYDAATEACPEHVDLDGSLADGEYILVVDLYANPYSGLALGEAVPVSVNYSQEFFDLSGTITISDYTTDSAGGTFPIATVTKSGYNYTVTPY